MDLKTLLEKHSFINKSALAFLMWGKKSSRITLHNKLNETIAGGGKQRITDDDNQKAIEVIDKFINDYKAFRKKSKIKP